MTKSKPSNVSLPSKEQLESAVVPLSDSELEVVDEDQEKIENLMRFFDQHGIDYSKFDPASIPTIDFGKKDAYPNNDVYMHVPGQHNTQKWLKAVQDIYAQETGGQSRVQAIRQITSGWHLTETFDFLNWVKFHESGDHMKYKFAQLWYENPDMGPGYFLQVKKDPETQSTPVAGRDVDFARQRAEEDSGRKERIEKQRNKIIGRLDSAEKLLRSPDGHLFSGKEFEALLESIYKLKKQIQMVNKISSSTRLYEDMIIRQANILFSRGFVKAAEVLHKTAQTPGASAEQVEGGVNKDTPIEPPPPPDPSGAGNPGAPGGLPSVGPGMPQGAPSSGTPGSAGNEDSPTPKGISDFLEGLEGAGFGPGDKQGVEDTLEVEDAEDNLLVTEAQLAPGAPPPPEQESITTTPAPAPLDPSPVSAPTPAAKAPSKKTDAEEPLEVTEEEELPPPAEGETPATSGFNEKMDAVLSGVTLGDVVAELEDLSKVFKTREIPRRLGRVDMMLDSLGLASYFPSLSEATNKALESNNYIATRVEDIISKLRGALSTKDVDLKGEGDTERPEMAGIKNKLQTDDEKEKARKQMRKDQEISEMSNKGKETPEVEIEEDLQAPPPPPVPRAAPV